VSVSPVAGTRARRCWAYLPRGGYRRHGKETWITEADDLDHLQAGRKASLAWPMNLPTTRLD